MKKIVGLFLLSTLLYGVDIVDDFGEIIDTTDKIYRKGSIEYAIADNMNIMIKEDIQKHRRIENLKYKVVIMYIHQSMCMIQM